MKRQTSETSDAAESFAADMDWFMGHVRSLSMKPEDCCTDQGNYLVAAELFYFLLEPTQLVDDPLSLLSQEQKSAVQRLRDGVRLVPPEARSGGTTAAASLTDMRHPSWVIPRKLANALLDAFLPLWPVSSTATKV
ncbi:MAG: hypothetical protein A3E00_02775 [Curvibacter sp. RIFCSPHIGHO2_12_FULL_63_18]|uniref:hypothetical protein n=1 Tax=Rhodoferax sp. TaxID=50421 RepID=UPI0008AB0353|nr:hypothetical protein [Rhodoferax sp.]OGO99847.1 MAG: hypothetical protein A2037_14330 [Curvibacter sp. GWA2_63_95]OGP06581.1 MAG: hypothetical protein A3E00_02775 [Curvibacter sp. RIFCSPHIGHO2_12_FULL_63_18]HCX82465.1 hypothetical protein [Rhodoferax sp.]